MKIESIIKRKKGTVVKMDHPTITYKFAPENGDFEEPHVAVVTDEGHARLFLRHTEAYRLYEGEAPAPLPEVEGPQPLGSSVITATSYKIMGGDTVDVRVLINMALDDSELEVEDWNALSDAERGDRINVVLNELQGSEVAEEEKPAAPVEKVDENTEEQKEEPAAVTGALNPDDFTRPQLVEMFQKRFGRKPSTQMDKPAIARALSQDDE